MQVKATWLKTLKKDWRGLFFGLVVFQFFMIVVFFFHTAQSELNSVDGTRISPSHQQLYHSDRKAELLKGDLRQAPHSQVNSKNFYSDSEDRSKHKKRPSKSRDEKEGKSEEIGKDDMISKQAGKAVQRNSHHNQKQHQTHNNKKIANKGRQLGTDIIANAVKEANKRALRNRSPPNDIHFDGKHDHQSEWDSVSTLPGWMKEYFHWHIQQTATLNRDNWRERSFFIMQCVQEDPHCGGASDRLKPLPLMLYLAYLHKRIFLIWWTRPCPLEEFLIPNVLNWTVPDFLPVNDQKENGKLVVKVRGINAWVKKNLTMIRTRMQSYEGGQLEYEGRANSTYNEIYHDLFRLIFQPSPAIAKILQREMTEVNLIQGEYSVAHYRAFYARASRKESNIKATARNAVNCASVLRPGGPVYFASDSVLALDTVRDYASQNSYPIVTIRNQEPLHLDKAGNWSLRKPSDFYSIFVDLYLMGMGRCLTFGQGGFGRYGLLLGYNATCQGRHFYKSNSIKCDWTPSQTM